MRRRRALEISSFRRRLKLTKQKLKRARPERDSARKFLPAPGPHCSHRSPGAQAGLVEKHRAHQHRTCWGLVRTAHDETCRDATQGPCHFLKLQDCVLSVRRKLPAWAACCIWFIRLVETLLVFLLCVQVVHERTERHP